MSLRYGVIVLGSLMRFFYQEFILSSVFFRRETASGFYPWDNVDSPRKRVAEGLCGWRHGNSFPMTQSAQSHRQMRSIPLCPKAVFYVFVSVPQYLSTEATLHHNVATCLWHVSMQTNNVPSHRKYTEGTSPRHFSLNPIWIQGKIVVGKARAIIKISLYL